MLDSLKSRIAKCGRHVATAIVLVTSCVYLAGVATAQEFQVDEIVVEGNQRLERETVLSHLTFEVGGTVSAADINASLRALTETGLFEDVAIEPGTNSLTIRVVERSFINAVEFEGNEIITSEILQSAIRSEPRTVFSPVVVEEDARRIVEAYGRAGRLSATVAPQLVERDGNRVDIIFEIDEGPISRIRKVSFIGNRAFSDSTLRDVVESKEAAWYRIFASTDMFDAGRVDVDQEALTRYYNGRGYADFEVLSVVSSLTESGSGFVITFTVSEGPRYEFGEINVSSEAMDVEVGDLADYINFDPGELYDGIAIERTATAMLNDIENQGIAFVTVDTRIEKDPENRTVTVDFVLVPSIEQYVERIEIEGNVRTLDEVIRRQFTFVEGDALNRSRIAATRRNIRGLRFFGNVDIRTEPGSREDRVIVRAVVEERSTGSLTFGIGYSSSSKFVGSISLEEQNLLGRGQRLKFTYETSNTLDTYQIGFTEPYFLNRDLAAGIDMYRTTTDDDEDTSYTLTRTGISPEIEFSIGERTRFTADYKLENKDITSSGGTSPLLQVNPGRTTLSSLGYELVWDRRDDPLEPRTGIVAGIEQELAGLGGDTKFASIQVFGRYFTPLDRDEQVIGSVSLRGGAVESFGGYELQSADRFYLGGSRLRGFSPRGIGPIDDDELLGGKYYSAARVEVTSNFVFPEELGIRSGIFLDAGTLFGLDKTSYDVGTPPADRPPCPPVQQPTNCVFSVDDSVQLRASAGVVLFWSSPIGPMQFTFAKPLKEQDGDETESFRFTVGSPF